MDWMCCFYQSCPYEYMFIIGLTVGEPIVSFINRPAGLNPLPIGPPPTTLQSPILSIPSPIVSTCSSPLLSIAAYSSLSPCEMNTISKPTSSVKRVSAKIVDIDVFMLHFFHHRIDRKVQI
jgi:hypothetical protein